MSFHRLIFYSAAIGGWAAFAGWLLSELLLLRRSSEPDLLPALVMAGLVAGAIAAGLNLLSAASTGRWQSQMPRALIGLVGGFIGGVVGAAVGNLVYAFMPRAFGWMVMGLAIGSVDGIYEGSRKKIRNGLIGGGIGGLLGGLLFDPLSHLTAGAMSSRATAFVILGIFIGLFIGLAQVILKEAWLTVVEGFRPGRQLILNRPETVLGTSEKAQLPFIAYGAKGVEPVHARILQQPDGTFVLHDNESRTGTEVNGQRVKQPVLLRDGDVIRLGSNTVRYSESFRRSERGAVAGAARPKPPEAIVAGPPPVVGKAAAPRPRQTSDIQVGIPVAPPPGRGSPPAAMPARHPTPPSNAPTPPAYPQAQPVGPSSAGGQPIPPPPPQTSDQCPICGRPAKGPAGKRICQNCGIRF